MQVPGARRRRHRRSICYLQPPREKRAVQWFQLVVSRGTRANAAGTGRAGNVVRTIDEHVGGARQIRVVNTTPEW
jgi:hypothetical protein